MAKGWCDGGQYGCGNPATFVARNEAVTPGGTWEYGERHGVPRELSTTFQACGKHLATLINAFPIPSGNATRFLVVPMNPNVSEI